jgi:hypothetical protein
MFTLLGVLGEAATLSLWISIATRSRASQCGRTLTNTQVYKVVVLLTSVKSFIELIPDMKMFLLVSLNKKRISLATEH